MAEKIELPEGLAEACQGLDPEGRTQKAFRWGAWDGVVSVLGGGPGSGASALRLVRGIRVPPAGTFGRPVRAAIARAYRAGFKEGARRAEG